MGIFVFKTWRWEDKLIGSKWPEIYTSDLYIGATTMIFRAMNNFLT